jgi:hypothetical protein
VDILDNDYLTTSKCPDRLNIFQLPNVVFQHYKPISHSNRAIKTNTSNPLKYSHIKQDKMRDEHTKKKKNGKKESTHRARVKLKELSNVSLPLALPLSLIWVIPDDDTSTGLSIFHFQKSWKTRPQTQNLRKPIKKKKKKNWVPIPM